MTLVGLGMLDEGALMRIPDYRNVHGVKDSNHWTPKTSRVEKAHEDEFEKELEDSVHKIKSRAKRKRKKILTPNEEMVKIQLEIDHMFVEHEQKIKWETAINSNEDTPNDTGRFSNWGQLTSLVVQIP